MFPDAAIFGNTAQSAVINLFTLIVKGNKHNILDDIMYSVFGAPYCSSKSFEAWLAIDWDTACYPHKYLV